MKIQFFCKNCTGVEQEKFEKYIEKKFAAIERLLKKFDADSVTLEIKMQKFEKHKAYKVEFVLRVSRRKFVGEETSHTITKAVDLAKDRLIVQLKKFEEKMRRK